MWHPPINTELERHWQRVGHELEQSQTDWNDSTRFEFDKRFVASINAAIASYLAVSRQLDEAVAEVERFFSSLD